MYLLSELQNKHFVILILIFGVSLAHLGYEMKRDNIEGVGNGAKIREKRALLETVGVKLGQLGITATKFFPYLLRSKKAKKILVLDAKLVETKIELEGHKVFKYKKQGGCIRATKDFRMMDVANIESYPGPPGFNVKIPTFEIFSGVVGGEIVKFRLDNYSKEGCSIKIGRASTPGRKSGNVIIVNYQHDKASKL